jgi:hypothetical protein
MGLGRSVYQQVLAPAAEPGVSGPIAANENFLEHNRNHQGLPLLRGWTRALLQRLVDQKTLPAAVLGRPGEDDRVPPEHYEAVAKALEAFLKTSGAFKYSLTLERKDETIDPIEDFVLNTHKGHCTRFATALALMLRSQGVPTRVVLGYRGWESDGDGRYEVRQCHAHSWVEALIPRPADRPDGPPTWRWLTLDPTPDSEEAEEAGFQWGNWWEATRLGVTSFFKNFIVEYDADVQDRTRVALGSVSSGALGQGVRTVFLGPSGDDWGRAVAIAFVGLGAVLGAYRVVRRRRRGRPAAADPSTSFYRRLLALCASRLGAAPRRGETPGEFAAATAGRLRAAPATRHLADVPAETAVLFYRVRFGGRPLAAPERRDLEARLDGLEAALPPAPAG